MPVTKEQVHAAISAIQAIANAIKELGSVPSGQLYAVVMSHCSLSEYQKIIGILKNADLVSESMNVLTWKGAK